MMLILALLPALAFAAETPATLNVNAKKGPAADIAFSSWLDANPAIRESLTAADVKAAASRPAPIAMPSDVRDAVAAKPTLKTEIAALPGMKAPAVEPCANLRACAVPPLVLDVDDARDLRPAVHALVRPWILLQEARRGKIRFQAAPSGDRVLAFSIPDLKLSDVAVNVSPRQGGGFRVWLDQGLLLSARYHEQRAALLK